jgi:hypothetical protein
MISEEKGEIQMSYKQKPFVALIIVVIAAVLSAVSISFAGSGPNMQEGLWEITTKMEMPGMPMSMPSMTHTQCITNENMVPRGSSQQAEECKITETKVEGDTVTWTMKCDSPEGNIKAIGKITYSGDTFKGTIKMTMQGMETIQHLSGHRIGNCRH